MRASFFLRISAATLATATMSTALVVSPSGAATTSYVATPIFARSLGANVPLVRLHFNHPISASQLQNLTTSPPLVMHWQQIGGREVQAVTTSTIIPDTNYTFRVPVQLRCNAVSCSNVATVRHSVLAGASELWLQELFAKLNYLPVRFTPNVPSPRTAFVPGTFAWKFPAMPIAFKAMWRTGAPSIIMTGAIKRFQDEHNIINTGVMDAYTWGALLRDARLLRVNATPYDYVDVYKGSPEILTLYRNGKVIYTTPVNTGIAQAPTADGTYPVYVRFDTTTMSGTNPDGSKYHDTGIPWVSYFNGGDALHGFIRGSYGWPQSLGCVEMPFDNAHVVYKYTPIGTLVTVH